MAVIGSLSVKLGLVTVEWDKATSQAKKQAKDLQNAFNDLGLGMGKLKNLFNQLGGAAGLSIAGFGAMAHSVLTLAGSLDDLSKTYDVSIAKVLQFQNAIIQAGGKSEDAGKIMATMFAKIAEAQQGNEAAIATFEDLGISFAELRSMNPEQALTRVYQGLAGIGNTYDRIKAVKEILGRGGLHKSVEEIAEALGQSTAEFRRQEEALKKWAELGDRIDRMMLNLKLAFAEFFSVFTGSDFIPSVNQFKSAMVAITAVAVVSGMFKLVAAFRALNTALKSTAALGMALSAAGGIKGIAMAGAGLAAYFGAMKAFESADAESDATVPEVQQGGGTPESGKTGDRRVIAAGMAKIKLAKEMLEFDRRRHEYQMAYLTGSQDELALGESAIQQAQDIAKATQVRAEALKAENLSAAQKGLVQQQFDLDMKKAQQERDQRDELINAKRQIALDILNRQIDNESRIAAIKGDQARLENERVHMTTFAYEKQREELALQEKLLGFEIQRAELKAQWKGHEMSPEFVDGMALINGAEATERALSQIRQRGVEADRMRQEDFVTGWNYAFEQYLRSAQNYGSLASDMFQSFVGNMNSAIDTFVKTGKFSFKDFAKSVIQDIMAMILKFQMLQMVKMAAGAMGFGIPGFADGGSPPVNQPSLVGEAGPELFIPKTSGTIIPNSRLGSALGGGQTVNYNGPYIANMSAIDTQSGTQFLARNKMAVWSANQSASRSVPQSR
ncbi:Bacteriophage lambda, GpH, tail tape measure, C-terminal [uncultured Caudovirales phage]|uniref:Bacteriophage lambda, GpH, tail tape measure, C-terminal n=1 Tax=uncultured Caudovirales phage TaxID=2100421 RepID=A0A6J5R6D6_9CAUD|nr:Bacteriophage lambda, GpH, tail tape measure, C-terminal [uncultured Caudovirales phage]CAB4219253.1 Bacteriophage lambda, GpH, tail tape measure, C-terminal [uncultured Caudovirales phage]